MRTDTFSELVSEQKLFILIQLLILIVTIILVVFYAIAYGIGDNNTDNTVKKEAICGDGVLDKGETQENCCQDTGCQGGYTCLVNGNDGYTCQALQKSETKEFKEIEKLGRTLIEQAYIFEEAANEIELSKTLLERNMNTLEERGFNLEIERDSYQSILLHLETIKTIDSINKETEIYAMEPAYLQVFYLEEGSPKKVEDELLITQNTSQRAMNVIKLLQTTLKNKDEEVKTLLNESFEFDTKIINEEYDILLAGFNESYTKATRLLSEI